MPQGDSLLLLCLGVGFIVLGIIGILWGKHEDKSYFNHMAEHHDVREFVAHWPERPQPGALKIGGWIAMGLGVVLLVMGIVYWIISASAV